VDYVEGFVDLGQRRAEQLVELLRAEASAHDEQNGLFA
jgi:hypothetical protein